MEQTNFLSGTTWFINGSRRSLMPKASPRDAFGNRIRLLEGIQWCGMYLRLHGQSKWKDDALRKTNKHQAQLEVVALPKPTRFSSRKRFRRLVKRYQTSLVAVAVVVGTNNESGGLACGLCCTNHAASALGRVVRGDFSI
jgi:hypothetical protein